jgi:hypothetical protein
MLFSLVLVILLAQGQIVADSILVLKNGAEVRGQLVEVKDGKYTVDLLDGRRMTYSIDEVESLRRLTVESPAGAPVPKPCGIIVTEERVPVSWYTPIKKVKWAKGWYGSNAVGFEKLASEAAKLGADAVVQAVTSHGWTAWSVASPKAEGLAVKWTAEGRGKASAIEAECYPAALQK